MNEEKGMNEFFCFYAGSIGMEKIMEIRITF